VIEFPVSGVETYWWLPVAVAFVISVFTSTAGVSGAFILLPFQVSVLSFGGPAVSPTNLMFNVVAIPSGVYRYHREKRMVWPLAWTIVLSTLPGIILGAVIRIRYLPDARSFKLFAAFVLLYLGVRLGMNLFRRPSPPDLKAAGRAVSGVSSQVIGFRRISYGFNGSFYGVTTWKLFLLSFLVGIVGGVYGIGGGAIIAPFLVAGFRLPVHSIAGACLFGTFVSSIGGVLFYVAVAPFAGVDSPVTPDWLLGFMFGIGGAVGMYAGARLQKFLPERIIKAILTVAVLIIVVKYVLDFFS
jgi:hypothetical protein